MDAKEIRDFAISTLKKVASDSVDDYVRVSAVSALLRLIEDERRHKEKRNEGNKQTL